MIRFGIKVKILNFWSKIPNIPCLILTTSEELKKIKNPNENLVNILLYDENEKFEEYITRLLAAYRIGYQENYSEFTFSIDPGTKHIGLVIFLDSYYLNSHTFFNIESLLEKVKEYNIYLQKGQKFQINLVFKIGMGVLATTLELASNLFSHFKEYKNMQLFLIDESKTSQIRIYSTKKKIPKHEVSALVLALRDGIEIDKENHVKVFKDIKNKRIRLPHYNNIFQNNNDNSSEKLKELILKMLNGEISLTESSEKLIQFRIDEYE